LKAVAQSVTSSPALGNIDLDGDIEIVVGGKGAAGTDDSLYIWDLATQFSAQRVPWPMFHHDPRHTGRFPLQGYAVKETNARPITTTCIFPTIITEKISLITKNDSRLHLRIFNIAGIEMKGNGLDLSNLPAGVYFVKYWSEDNTIQGMVKCVILKQ